MDMNQTNEGEIKVVENAPVAEPAPVVEPAPVATTTEPEKTENPTVKKTDTAKPTEETPAPAEPAKEMSADQFELYNETLRRVSKTAKTDLQGRYNAFEDTEVKALVKQQIMAGEKPSIKDIAAGIVTRLTPKAEPKPEQKAEPQTTKTDNADEVASLKAELALLKAGIVPERIEAAKKLFLAENGDPDKVAEFVEKYPEWKAGQANNGVTFTKAQPVNGKTAPNPSNQPVMNDFEKKVYEARKARGLPT